MNVFERCRRHRRCGCADADAVRDSTRVPRVGRMLIVERIASAAAYSVHRFLCCVHLTSVGLKERAPVVYCVYTVHSRRPALALICGRGIVMCGHGNICIVVVLRVRAFESLSRAPVVDEHIHKMLGNQTRVPHINAH